MKNKLRSEFWFQIYDNRYQNTDKIFAFFLEWKSDNHYALNKEEGQKKANARRFQVVKPHENLTDLIDQSLKADLHRNYSSTNRLLNKFETFTKDWEMVNLQELELKLKTEKEIEKEYKTLPTLMNESLILKEEHLRKLNVNLIARAIGYNWILSFSTEEHGFSLGTMYRKLADVETPCLVVVKDTNNNVFGAMSSTKLYQSEHFYGTGESFLFTFTPTFRVFKWTGENNFFTRGQAESIAFGCSDGHHGLWFDGDLLNGHTQKCQTYDNDLLTTQEDFTIASLEVWSFSDE